MDAEISHRVGEGAKFWERRRKLRNKRDLSVEEKKKRGCYKELWYLLV